MWDILTKNMPVVILIVVAIIICGADLIKAIGVWSKSRKDAITRIQQEYQEKQDILDEFEAIHDRFDQLDEKIDALGDRVCHTEKRINDLTMSDMHDIKAWIVEQYHKFYVEQGWIDAFNAETIDNRYEDYLKEGGNSYIKTLIDRLHTLPMDPPDFDVD